MFNAINDVILNVFCHSVLLTVLLQQKKKCWLFGERKGPILQWKTFSKPSENVVKISFLFVTMYWRPSEYLIKTFPRGFSTSKKRHKNQWKTFSKPPWNVVKTSKEYCTSFALVVSTFWGCSGHVFQGFQHFKKTFLTFWNCNGF